MLRKELVMLDRATVEKRDRRRKRLLVVQERHMDIREMRRSGMENLFRSGRVACRASMVQYVSLENNIVLYQVGGFESSDG